MSGLQAKYSELLTMSIQQRFYENEICRSYKTEPVTDFTFAITDESTGLMKRIDLIFKKADVIGGFTVLAATLGKNADDNDLLKFSTRKHDLLTVLMLAKNPDVNNYNDLPLDAKNDQLYYFSNQVNDSDATRNNLHLSNSAEGVKKEDRIKKANENYIYSSSGEASPGTVKVKHLVSSKEVQPKSINNVAGTTTMTFDLSLLPSGKCNLLLDGLVTDVFYYLKSTSFSSVFGVIEIALSSTIEANYRVIEPDRSVLKERPKYLLRFLNRKTIWRYTIKLNTNSPLYLEMAALSPTDKTEFTNKINITEQGHAITFFQESITDTSFVFVSTVPVFLQEKYYSSPGVGIQLILKKYVGDARETSVKSNLPYPGTESVNALNLPNIYSDLFITI